MNMNFRNKDLIQVFEERYQANHNKKLNEEVKNNKKNMADRMFGNNINNNRVVDNKQNVIGYDSFNRKGRV